MDIIQDYEFNIILYSFICIFGIFVHININYKIFYQFYMPKLNIFCRIFISVIVELSMIIWVWLYDSSILIVWNNFQKLTFVIYKIKNNF